MNLKPFVMGEHMAELFLKGRLPRAVALMYYLTAAEGEELFTAKELAKTLGISNRSANVLLLKLMGQGYVQRVARGVFRLNKEMHDEAVANNHSSLIQRVRELEEDKREYEEVIQEYERRIRALEKELRFWKDEEDEEEREVAA